MPTRRWPFLPALLGLCLVLGASCGDDDDGDASAEDTGDDSGDSAI